jgi:hypothetical protein
MLTPFCIIFAILRFWTLGRFGGRQFAQKFLVLRPGLGQLVVQLSDPAAMKLSEEMP